MAQAIREAAKEATRDAVAADMTPLDGVDLQEWYFAQGCTDGLPVVPPTRGEGRGDGRGARRRPDLRRGAGAAALGQPHAPGAGDQRGDGRLPARLRSGAAHRTAGDVRRTDFNLNAVQATTHVVAPLPIVNGPVARADRHEWRPSAPSAPATGPTPRSAAPSA